MFEMQYRMCDVAIYFECDGGGGGGHGVMWNVGVIDVN